MARERLTIGGIEYRVQDLMLESNQNNFDKFTCTLPIARENIRQVLGRGGHKYPDHYVEILDKDGSTVIFRGFLEKVSDQERGLGLILEGRDTKVLLLDERTGRDRWINQTGTTIVNGLMAYSSKVTLGSNVLTNLISGTVRFEHQNLLQAIASLCDSQNVDFWINTEPILGDMAFVLHIGHNAIGTINEPNRTLSAGAELFEAKVIGAAKDIINRQRVLGAGDGINQIQVCVPYMDASIPDTQRSQGFNGYNADCLHPIASQSQLDVGIMEGKPYINHTILDTEVAIHSAKRILDTSLNQTVDNVEVSVSCYIQGLLTGEWCRIIDVKKGIDTTNRVKKIVRRFLTNSMTIEFVTPNEELASMLVQAQRESLIGDFTGIGATNLISFNFPDVCDTTHPYEFVFQMPPEVKFIDRIQMSYLVSGYRAYSGTTSGGTPHSHSLRVRAPLDNSQIGMVGVQTYNFENYLVSNTNLTAIKTAEAESEHTHGVAFAITEQVANISTVSILIDDGQGYVDITTDLETELGQALSGIQQMDLKLTNYFTADGGIKRIQIVPYDNEDGECRITGLLSVMFYMESR